MTEMEPMPGQQSGKRRWLRLLGAALMILAVLLIFYAVIAYYALRSGADLRQQRIEEETTASIQRQLDLARADIETQNYDLALNRLDWIINHESNLADAYRTEASQLRGEAERRQAEMLTPTVTTTPPPPTLTPTITPTPEPVEGLEAIETLVSAEAWAEAIPAILAYQTANPDYQRHLTDQLLFDAYVGYGVELLYTDDVERGMAYLRQAEELGPLPQEALDLRSYADLYVKGLAVYGVDWRRAILFFSDLCLVAPFYQDACDRLYTARVSFADQLAQALDWCPAEIFYTDAWRQRASQSLNEKRLEASQRCLEATPTPDPNVTPSPDPNAPTPTPTPEGAAGG